MKNCFVIYKAIDWFWVFESGGGSDWPIVIVRLVTSCSGPSFLPLITTSHLPATPCKVLLITIITNYYVITCVFITHNGYLFIIISPSDSSVLIPDKYFEGLQWIDGWLTFKGLENCNCSPRSNFNNKSSKMVIWNYWSYIINTSTISETSASQSTSQ